VEQQPPPQQPWGARPPPPPQWGYRPPEPPQKAPEGPPPWYRHPVGLLLIGAGVVIVLTLFLPVFTGDGQEPVPTVTTGAFGGTQPTVGPAATTTSSTLATTEADRLAQAAQAELGGAGQIAGVTAPPAGPITITWEITRAGSPGLTANNARFAVMRIMRAVQQTGLAASGGGRDVRLIGRYQLPGQATPTTVVRLRFEPATVQRTSFDDRRYLEAYELADAAVVDPAFRG
jgi:hypothetical protein